MPYPNGKRQPGLKGANAKLMLHTNQKLKKWTDYINELFGYNRMPLKTAKMGKQEIHIKFHLKH